MIKLPKLVDQTQTDKDFELNKWHLFSMQSDFIDLL